MRLGLIRGTCYALTILLAQPACAGEWRTRTLELRQDRFYFPVGEEEFIYADSPFRIVKGADIIYEGWIEHSWQGVSASAPTHGFFDTLPLSGLEAVVTQADIDSTQPIIVGAEFEGLRVRADTVGEARIKWSYYGLMDPSGSNHNPREPLREDFLSGDLDAALVLTDLDPRPADVTTVSAPLPYVVVLVPNIRRECNFHGELTTSLYYRFDNSRLALCFKGDRPVTVNRLTSLSPVTAPMPRWYEFDPDRGKKLLGGLSHRGSRLRLRLHSDSRLLDGVERYFADLLSREQCVVELTPDRALADVSIELVPCSNVSPRVVMDKLYERMVQDSAAGSPPAEYLRRIHLEMRGLETSLTSEDSSGHLETVSRILAEDLGVFPLFRPRMFVHTHEALRNVVLSPEGLVDFSKAVRVRLPEPPSGVPR